MKRSAFTLIELLVVVAIICILTTLSIAVAGKVKKHGNLTRELSAGRNLATAYILYANEHDGELLGGYVSDAEEVLDDTGREVTNPANGRYPWRLAKYLPGPVKGTLIVNEQEKLTEQKDHDFYVYLVAFAPTFGINATYLGGDFRSSLAPTQGALNRYGLFCITRLSQAIKPQKLIVFASAHYKSGVEGEQQQQGHHTITPPNTTTRRWSAEYDEKGLAEEHGYVHLRYGGKAVTVMLDGHVELLDYEQLKDMRRWSNQAAELDQPDFKISRL
jgi:prepilin-type N-terminal cleavage/methylation domain-containing protein/prepilin-type processing-associated H-X9-DG protein